ncbi:hypothetical protein GCM10020000_06060 [Streptomyces olivoverticillatus]
MVFVHGGPVPADMRPTPRDWPSFLGYGQYVANSGAVGVTVDHRLHDLADYERAAQDVAEAIELVRADPRVDEDRVALWFFSGGSLMSADWLATPPRRGCGAWPRPTRSSPRCRTGASPAPASGPRPPCAPRAGCRSW